MNRIIPRAGAPLALAALATMLALAAPAAAQEDAQTVDLSLRFGPDGATYQAGALAHMGFNATNEGETTATGVVVRIDVPDGTEFAGGAPGCAMAEGESVVVCHAEDLPPGAFIGYSVTLRFFEPGVHDLLATIESNEPESDMTDNADTARVTVTPAPLATPQDFTCIAEDDGIRVSWSPVAGATSYRFVRADEDGFADTIWTVEETEVFDTRVVAGEVYQYRVWALGPGGAESAPTAWCEVTAVPMLPGGLAGLAVGAAALVGFVALRRRLA